MPLALHEEREGQVIFVCPGKNAYQQRPSFLSEGEDAEWFAMQNMVFRFIPHNFGTFIPFVPLYGEYAYNMGLGPSGLGYKQYTSQVVQPMVQAEMISHWIDPFHALLPDGPYYEDSPLENIPVDAWITRVYWTMYFQSRPTNWQYAIHSVTHSNTLLPQSADLPDTVLPYYVGDDVWAIEEETINVTPGTINARDACLQDFNLNCIFRHDSGTATPDLTPILSIPYIVMGVTWEGIAAEAIDQWDGAPFGFGMTMAADIQRQRLLSGTLPASMTATAAINLIGNLDGTLSMPMYNIADATNNEGGIDNGIDNTGWFNADLSFDAPLVGQLAIEGELSMSLNMDIEGITRTRHIGGTLSGSMDTYAFLLKDATLWVDEDSFAMSMGLVNTGYGLSSERSLAGALPFSMVIAGNIVTQQQLAATMAGSMALTAVAYRRIDVAGTLPLGMALSGTIVRNVDVSGAYNASLSFYSNISYDYSEPALEENTLTMGAPDRTIYQGSEDRTVYTDDSPRTIFVNPHPERN